MGRRKKLPGSLTALKTIKGPLAVELLGYSEWAGPLAEVTTQTMTLRTPLLRIHTYFEACHQESYETELALLLLWQKRWQEIGYGTVVLNESHARAHPLYAEYVRKVDTFPSVNRRDYERACWLRWLALEMAGGGVMSDYDVFPRKEPIFGSVVLPVCNHFTIFESGVPSLASGTVAAIRELVTWILSLPDGYTDPAIANHFSDMIAVRGFPELQTESCCVQHGDKNWLDAPFIHFSHSSTHPKGFTPRHQHIDALMALKP